MSYWYFVNERRHVLEATEERPILLAELPTVDEAFLFLLKSMRAFPHPGRGGLGRAK